MRGLVRWIVAVALGLFGSAGAAWAHEEHAGGTQEPVAENTATEQTLTGEVVDVFCYLHHGKDGLGKGHAGCAKKCIQSGLPVAIKVGDRLYLAAMASHDAANKALVDFAGEQVTVHGHVMEKDGQHLISITRVENPVRD
jgi:hypothetical protein